MAGDWIPILHATPLKREVMNMARALKITRWEVVGRLIDVWAWADREGTILKDGPVLSRSCHVPSVTLLDVDDAASAKGFGRAMQAAGWVVEHDGGLRFPNGDRYMTQTAKQRLLTSRRKQRERGKCHGNVTQMSRPDRDESVTTDTETVTDTDQQHIDGIAGNQRIDEHNDQLGGAGPPPRETKDLPGVAHLRVLIEQFNAGEANPTGRRLFVPSPQKLREKLLLEGVEDSELEALTVADLKKSIAAADHRGHEWGAGWLKGPIRDRRKGKQSPSRLNLGLSPQSPMVNSLYGIECVEHPKKEMIGRQTFMGYPEGELPPAEEQIEDLRAAIRRRASHSPGSKWKLIGPDEQLEKERKL